MICMQTKSIKVHNNLYTVTVVCIIIRESVDSLCRDVTETQSDSAVRNTIICVQAKSTKVHNKWVVIVAQQCVSIGTIT